MDGTENNILVSCWGPPAWAFLHSVAAGYPESVPTPTSNTIAQSYKKFFESLGSVLPCKWCKIHYKENIKELPIDKYLGGRKDLSHWVYLIHNKVNEKTSVPKSSWPSFATVYKLYDGMRSSTCTGIKDTKTIEQTCNQAYDSPVKKRCKVEFNSDLEVLAPINYYFI